MHNKPLSEKILIGIGILVFLAFQIGIRVMNWQVKSESHPAAVQEGIQSDYVKLTVNGPIKYDLKEFQAVQTGMTFPEVTRALHLAGLKQTIGEEIPNPNNLDALVVFKDVNGSTIEVVFHDDKVVSKRRFGAAMNSLIERENERNRR